MTANPSFQTREVGRYRLLSLLGEGGAAHTYLGEHTATQERFAIKELRLLKSTSSKQIELFERECAILQGLDHPQIPKFVDNVVERRDETLSLYLVQELIAGRSLQQLLDQGVTFAAADVVGIMKSCLAPLAYLHERTPPLFHRDIKPANIIQRPDGSCVLVDFGAVRESVLDAQGRGSSVVGTFGYMAPEQFQARANASSDLYGLGATALHLLSGVEPGRFPLKRLKPEISAHLDSDPHMMAILDILLEPASEDRYESAAALRGALDRWHEPSPEPGSEPSTGPSAEVNTTPPDTRPGAGARAASTGVSGDTARRRADAHPKRAASKRSRGKRGKHHAANDGTPDVAGAPSSGQVEASAATPTVETASSAPRPASAAQQLPRTETSERAAVFTERAPAAEFLLPGGQGARELAPGIGLFGAAAAGLAAFGGPNLDNTLFTVIATLLLAYALALAFIPRRPAGRASRAARSGPTADVEIRRVVKRTALFGRPEWLVEFGYVAADQLHYENTVRLPTATAARDLVLDPSSVGARYAELDPAASVLVNRNRV